MAMVCDSPEQRTLFMCGSLRYTCVYQDRSRRAMPTCTSTSLPEKIGSAEPDFAPIRTRPLARRCGTRDEGGNDTHDGDPYEEHNMGGLRVQRGMRTAHEDVIDMWQGIIDADHEREQRDDDRSIENRRVLRGTFLLVLSRRWLLPSCWCLLVPLRWLSPLVQ